MATIKYNNTLRVINRIVAYGCSYTFGSELADIDFIENAEAEKRNLGLAEFNRKYGHIITSPELIAKQQERVWPTLLANKLNVDVLNRAAGGTSLEHSVMTFRDDLFNKRIKKTDLVLLGITTLNRWLHIHPKKYNIINFVSSVIDENDPLHRAMVAVYDDFTLYTNHLTQLEHASTEALSHDSLFLGFPMTQDFKIMYTNKIGNNKSLEATYHNVLRMRTKRVMRNDHYKWDLDLTRFSTAGRLLGGNHWSTEVHEEFSNAIYQRIKL